MEEVHSLSVELGAGVEEEDVVLPVGELVEGEVGQLDLEGVPDLVLYLFG